jgi:hypothetical protein
MTQKYGKGRPGRAGERGKLPAEHVPPLADDVIRDHQTGNPARNDSNGLFQSSEVDHTGAREAAFVGALKDALRRGSAASGQGQITRESVPPLGPLTGGHVADPGRIGVAPSVQFEGNVAGVAGSAVGSEVSHPALADVLAAHPWSNGAGLTGSEQLLPAPEAVVGAGNHVNGHGINRPDSAGGTNDRAAGRPASIGSASANATTSSVVSGVNPLFPIAALTGTSTSADALGQGGEQSQAANSPFVNNDNRVLSGVSLSGMDPFPPSPAQSEFAGNGLTAGGGPGRLPSALVSALAGQGVSSGPSGPAPHWGGSTGSAESKGQPTEGLTTGQAFSGPSVRDNGAALDLSRTNDLLQQLLDEVRRGSQRYLPMSDRNTSF